MTLRLYHALIQMPGEALSQRASVEAWDLADARRMLEEQYEEARIWSLWNEDDAHRPR